MQGWPPGWDASPQGGEGAEAEMSNGGRHDGHREEEEAGLEGIDGGSPLRRHPAVFSRPGAKRQLQGQWVRDDARAMGVKLVYKSEISAAWVRLLKLCSACLEPCSACVSSLFEIVFRLFETVIHRMDMHTVL